MKTLLLAVGFSLLLSGCGAESDAKKAVLGSLKDPDSAKFGKFTQVEKSACLTVNARNSMGGYTGDQQAVLLKANKEWVVGGIEEMSHDACIKSIGEFIEKHEEKPRDEAREFILDCPKIEPKDCLDCFDMVDIPAGNFDMGSDYDDSSEKPVHRVRISRSFALGKTEVTQGQWKAVMGNNPSGFKNCDDTLPVENVSWNDIKDFIRKLNTKTAKQYRLPTEAEWEYACYGGSRSNGNHCGAQFFTHGESTISVGTRGAEGNGYGLYGMNGNVSEWVEDIYHDNYNGAPTDGSAWQGNDGKRVLRGASYFVERGGAVRYRLEPALRGPDYGFRLARTLP